MGKRQFVIAKQRGQDVFKVYENNEDRSYVGVFKLNEENLRKVALSMSGNNVDKTYKEDEKTLNRDVKFEGKLIGTVMSKYDVKQVGKEIIMHLDLLKKARNENI